MRLWNSLWRAGRRTRSSQESWQPFRERLDPTLEELDDIKTAVSEAVTNAVIHGYRGQEGKIYLSATAWEKGAAVFCDGAG